MGSRSSYMIVFRSNQRPRGLPGRAGQGCHRAGRHRAGAPGTVPRDRANRQRLRRHRGAHRRARKPSVLATRYATLVLLLGTVAVSGWFTATGAAAFAQMVG